MRVRIKYEKYESYDTICKEHEMIWDEIQEIR